MMFWLAQKALQALTGHWLSVNDMLVHCEMYYR